jgi:hypothetical protein
MRREIAGRADQRGLYLATAALLLVLAQIVMGRVLLRLRGSTRLRLQKVHFWTMVTLLTLTTGHVLLNGPFIGQLGFIRLSAAAAAKRSAAERVRESVSLTAPSALGPRSNTRGGG